MRWLILALGAAALGALFVLSGLRQAPSGGGLDVERLGESTVRTGDFRLIREDGTEVGSELLRGQVWVGSVMFTRCAGQCPVMMSRLQRLQADVPGLRLVAFTSDPVYDSPSVLREYARRWDADPERWWFLTGSADELGRAVEGLKFMYPEEPAMHTTRFVLVDRSGSVNGYYDASDPAAMDRLRVDARRLVGQAP